MSERRIESIKVIVKEHLYKDEFEKKMAEIRGEVVGSAVGVKITAGGMRYCTFVGFTGDTLSASEVEESVNAQIESLLKGLEGNDGKETD